MWEIIINNKEIYLLIIDLWHNTSSKVWIFRNKALKGCGGSDGCGGSGSSGNNGSGSNGGIDGGSGNNHNAMDTSW
jgi:hypothetical protein